MRLRKYKFTANQYKVSFKNEENILKLYFVVGFQLEVYF